MTDDRTELDRAREHLTVCAWSGWTATDAASYEKAQAVVARFEAALRADLANQIEAKVQHCRNQVHLSGSKYSWVQHGEVDALNWAARLVRGETS